MRRISEVLDGLASLPRRCRYRLCLWSLYRRYGKTGAGTTYGVPNNDLSISSWSFTDLHRAIFYDADISSDSGGTVFEFKHEYAQHPSQAEQGQGPRSRQIQGQACDYYDNCRTYGLDFAAINRTVNNLRADFDNPTDYNC